MFARTLAVFCTVLTLALLPARATAMEGLVNVAQAETVSGGTTQGEGSAASSVAAKPTKKPSRSLPNGGSAFQLSGVVIGPDIKYAILKHLTTNKTRTVRLGEDIDGWTADEITPEYVVLSREDERIRVERSSRSGVVNSGGSNILPNRSPRPAQPPQVMPSSSYSRTPATQTSHARQQQRAARRAQLAAERNARRIQQQQRLAACRLQAKQQRLKQQSRRAFIASCSGR
jgi:hypothetical protein